jgi:hypothetical protein
MSGLISFQEVTMDFRNPHLEELQTTFHSFHVEAFNIFALGGDQLPHLICACPNRNIALALCALLLNAEQACSQGITAPHPVPNDAIS